MMKWTAKLLPLSIGLAAGAALMAYALAARLGAVPVALGLGAGWLWSSYHTRQWIGDLCALGLLGTLLVGGLFNLPSGWLLGGMLALLAAWDLDHFRRRSRQVERVEAGDALEQRHLTRLAVVLGSGGGLAGLSVLLRLHLNFAVALLLLLLAAVGLSRIVTRLRRQSD